MTARFCPSANGRPCRRADFCLEIGTCHFNTAEGGRTFDSAVHEAPVRRAPPVQFVPDFGGVPVPQPWYKRIPIFRWCTTAGVLLICAFYIGGFVLRAINQFNH